MVPKKRAAFANYTSVLAAIHAREKLHCRPKPPALLQTADEIPGGGKADARGARSANERPLLINFTSAQENCMRARTGRQVH